MSLPALATVVEKGLLCWLAIVAAVVLLKCFDGRIALSGMLAQDAEDHANSMPAPERVQLLMGFFVALWTYANDALTQGVLYAPSAQNLSLQVASIGITLSPVATPTLHVPTMADVSPQFIALFAASHSIYLAGKFGRHHANLKKHARSASPETSDETS